MTEVYLLFYQTALQTFVHFNMFLICFYMTTKMRLRQLFDDGDISEVQRNTFYESVCAFYVRAMEYATRNLPLNDELLKNAGFLISIVERVLVFCKWNIL